MTAVQARLAALLAPLSDQLSADPCASVGPADAFHLCARLEAEAAALHPLDPSRGWALRCARQIATLAGIELPGLRAV